MSTERPLKLACLRVCAFKDALDARATYEGAISGGAGAYDSPDDHGMAWRRQAISPYRFAEAVLPFSRSYYDYESMQARDVDPRLVIAGTYNSYGPCRPCEVMDWSDGLACDTEKYNGQSPRIARIGRLPLYVALEGKNRVELFKRFRRRMRALVTDVPFPEPADLRIVALRPRGGYGVRLGDKLRVLAFHDVTIPLLRAYGVVEDRPLLSLRAGSVRRAIRDEVLASRMRP